MLWRGLWVSTALLLSVIQTGAAQNFPAIDAQTGVAPPIVRHKKPMQEIPAQNLEAPAQNVPAIDPQTGAAPRLAPPKKAMQKVPAENTSERAIPSTAAPTALGQEKMPASQDPRAAAAQHQSGLSESQARGLLQQRGYNSVSTLPPLKCNGRFAAHALDLSSGKKGGVKSFPQADRRLRISSIRCVLIKEPRGSDITCLE